MKSTLEGEVPPYLGIDPTDRYAGRCRPIDVCGLTPTENGKLIPSFWKWEWDLGGTSLDVTAILDEIKSSKTMMIDGPQGLANPGNKLRECERKCGAPGKTPDARPLLGRPFAGYICSSLDLFAALNRVGIPISPTNFLGGACEVYPGHIWAIIAGRNIPKKGTRKGRLVRRRFLEVLGVSNLPDLPTHDQNDACIAAILAAAADEMILCISGLKYIGSAVRFDGIVLREGPMVIPEVNFTAREAISRIAFNE